MIFLNTQKQLNERNGKNGTNHICGSCYPKYRKMYIRAFDKMLEVRKQRGKATQHANGLEVYHWWMQDGVLPGQLSFDGEDW